MAQVDLLPSFRVGMNKDWRQRINVDGCQSIVNLRSSEHGLHTFFDFDGLDAAFFAAATPAITPAWPYPQGWILGPNRLLFTETKVYTIDATWTVCVAQTTADWANWNWDTDAAPGKNITGNGRTWDIAFFGHHWIATNGDQLVFKTPFSLKVFVLDMAVESICSYKGAQVIMGGLDSTDDIWADIETYLETDEDDLPTELKGLYGGLDENGIHWTSRGAGEVWGLLDQVDYLKYAWFDDTKDTGFDTSLTYWRTLAERNRMGSGRLDEDVIRLVSFRDCIIACTSPLGIVPLWPQEGPYVTFGKRHPNGIFGIEDLDPGLTLENRDAIVAHNDLCAFIDKDKRLTVITPDYKATLVDCSKHLANLIDPVLSYNPERKEVWAADGDRAYCFPRDGGCCEAPYAPNGFAVVGGAISIWFECDEPDAITVSTNVYTAAAFGGKDGQVMAVMSARLATLNDDSDLGWEATLYYRTNRRGDWYITSTLALNDEGVVSFGRVPAIEFYVKFTHADRSTTHGLDGGFVEAQIGGPYGSREFHDDSASLVTVPTP